MKTPLELRQALRDILHIAKHERWVEGINQEDAYPQDRAWRTYRGLSKIVNIACEALNEPES